MLDITFHFPINEIERALNEFERRLQREVIDSLQEAGDVVIEEVRRRTPRASGELADGLQAQITGQGETTLLTVDAPDVPYAPHVEYDTRPHMPPVSAIEHWVELKGIAPAGEARRVAWAVAKVIAKRGTKGAHMFRDGRRAALPKVKRIVRAAYKRAAAGAFK